MRIEQWTGPPVETHTYLVIDEASREAWAIDAPLDTARAILDHASEHDLQLTRLILTHAHFDHLLDAPVYEAAGIPIALHPMDRPLLDAPQPALFGLPLEMPQFTVRQELQEGEVLRLGSDAWDVWHVPGHSPGHVVLYCAAQDTVLGGDLLFVGGYGRVDLPLADPAAMARSLGRLLGLPARTHVYPGHGPATTILAERSWLAPLITAAAL